MIIESSLHHNCFCPTSAISPSSEILNWHRISYAYYSGRMLQCFLTVKEIRLLTQRNHDAEKWEKVYCFVFFSSYQFYVCIVYQKSTCLVLIMSDECQQFSSLNPKFRDHTAFLLCRLPYFVTALCAMVVDSWWVVRFACLSWLQLPALTCHEFQWD